MNLFEKMVYRFRYLFTGKPVLPTGLPVLVDFNHCQLTGLPVLVSVYRSYQSINRSYGPVYRFSTSQMRNLNSERFSIGFTGFHGNRSYRWRAVFKAIPVFQSLIKTPNIHFNIIVIIQKVPDPLDHLVLASISL
jgi:hypothetical protein